MYLEFRGIGGLADRKLENMEMPSDLLVPLSRLVVAAFLGGAIGLEREVKHRPAGLRTNIFICVGAAMFTILSDKLAGQNVGDHTRIAAQIIPGIGFIGAGSILHYRGDLVTGITSAATIFVVASVGMAVGGGFYLTAIFATALILTCLFLLGRAEEKFSLKLALHTYEVTGPAEAGLAEEVNRVLECIHSMMQNVQVAATRQHLRMQFDVEGTHREQKKVLEGLKQSPIVESVTPLGPVQAE
ncbi:MAG: MgtC/SapB family protein [Acidobacteriales bacterium]|nr:MgtC/SapB family protein [Terriglobales bacterium]